MSTLVTGKSKVWSVDPAKPVDVAVGEVGLAAAEPITIGRMFQETVKTFPGNPALAFKDQDTWTTIIYTDYYDLCIRAAKSFLKLGLEPHHGVGIIGFNSTEWFVSSLGCIFAGGLSCGIYPTNSADLCQYIANNCKANVVVVEDNGQLQKFLQVRQNLPNLKAIVQCKGSLQEKHKDVYEWDEFLKLGDNTDSKVVEDIISSQQPRDCASLIYTSGTTGRPKGVMITHDNITWSCKCFADTYGCFVPGTEKIVSYLPLSHIAGQMLDTFLQIHLGGATYFAQPDAFKGSLAVTLKEVNPTTFFGVPRVWEKFYDKLNQMIPAGSMQTLPEEAKKAITQKVRAALGFSNVKLAVCGAAPVEPQILTFFASLGLKIQECWGMSEGCGPGTTSTTYKENCWKIGTVGKPFDGVEVKLANPDPKSGEGEVCFKGRNVMMGYLNQAEKTEEAIDEDGWLHSGDLGVIDNEGFLKVTGRMKELIITSGGKNIAPIPIEERIKKYTPFLSNVICIGDKRKYLTCLVTLKCTVDPSTGMPTDNLDPSAIQIISSLGSSSTKVSEIIICQDRAVFAAIQQGIDKANEEAGSHPQKVQKFTILKTDFSLAGGELGPTLKLRRFFVLKKYSLVIDKLYK